MIFGPPAAPIAITGSLSFKTIVGLMLERGRFPGWTEFASAPTSPKKFGTPGCVEKSSISSFITTPVPGTTTFDPNPVFTVAVQATQFPSASPTEKCVVCFLKTSCGQRGGAPCEGTEML